MALCKSCPAYFPTHTPNGEERRGVCRLEPPRTYRRFVKAKNPETGEEADVPVYDSAWPPVLDSHWCVRGRILMEKTGCIEQTNLTSHENEGPKNYAVLDRFIHSKRG